MVVATVESALSLDRVLDALGPALDGVTSEVLVVDASHDDSAGRAERHGRECAVVRHPPGTLVPVLWADGIRRSRGRFVALSTGHCVPPEGWGRLLVEALEDGAGGAGAGLVLRPEARAVDRAVFFLRYGAFLPQTEGEPRAVADVPGDNAAYHGDAVRAFVERRPEGFWELDFHAVLEEEGKTLRAVPAASAGFGRAFPFGTIFHHRWDHARHFGASRVRERGESVARVALAAPLVPLVLWLRNVRRASAHSGQLGPFLTASLPFLALASAWAGGEAFGALFGPGKAGGVA